MLARKEMAMTAALAAPPAVRPGPADLPDPGPGQELVDGEIQELNASYLSAFVAGNVYFALRSFVQAHNLGWVAPEGTSLKCFSDDPARVRRADTAFHRLGRLAAEQARAEGHLTVVPDLVVEVLSPNDLADDVNPKRVDWPAAGAALVWVIYPLDQEVHAFAAGGPVRVFGPADTLTADPVLPGFSAPVADLFRLPA
jgi:Uma2 family endonuclease